ncbi:HAMP domain-containing histidine kinase [bacterium SCSIO 12741]|nr:HAMP domain-containing histidine kinase [bacterium SCSIO 12741]
MNKRRNPTFWLYVLGIYILIQFFWWAWLLIDQGQTIITLSTNDPGEMIRRTLMIIGEGAVFLIMLVFGFYKVRSSLKREMELAKRQKNFLLSVTHELNSPLSSIKLSLETLIKRDLEKSKRDRISENALQETERLKELVNNILTSARLEEGKIQLQLLNENASELAQRAVNEFTTRFGENRMKSRITPGILIRVDQVAFRTVVENLLENAFKYNRDNGLVTLSLSSNGDLAVLEISDEGPGISEDNAERIYQQFYREQNEETRHTIGTGLGLYIVKNLVELHHGSISHQKNKNIGTTFRVEIPLSHA